MEPSATDDRELLAALDASIERSLEDIRAGLVESAEQVLERLGAKYAAMVEGREER